MPSSNQQTTQTDDHHAVGSSPSVVWQQISYQCILYLYKNHTESQGATPQHVAVPHNVAVTYTVQIIEGSDNRELDNQGPTVLARVNNSREGECLMLNRPA